MCFHTTPTRNDAERGFGEWQAPALSDGDILMFDECGRCAPHGTQLDYHSHHFRVVRGPNGARFRLLVKHGGGEEGFDIGYNSNRIIDILLPMDSDSRYLMLHALYDAHYNGAHSARAAEALKWRQAFAEGRVKRRKVRGQSAYKITIVC